jgi:hypothetical protein
MKKLIKLIIDNYLIKKNQVRLTIEKKENILNLIKRLNPHKTNRDLIRIGPNDDGGYLVPNDLEDIEACFSPGVYEITKFEYDCYNMGMKLFLADKSIEMPTINIPEDGFDFISKFIGSTDNDDFITLDTWVEESLLSRERDLILQMDIEGWEYLAIINASNDLLKRFRIIVIEFHDLHKLWNPAFFNIANQVFSKLLESHTCVHIHPNNDSVISDFNGILIPPLAEFTFYRNDRITSKSKEKNYPNSLDFRNVKNNPDIELPAVWYHS